MKAKINITLDEKLLAEIRKMAEDQNRNLSNMIEVLLQKVVTSK